MTTTTTPDLFAGLFAQEQPIPLRGIAIDVRLDGPCVRTTVAQRYENTEPTPIEAVYIFPLEEGAAVCAFAATIGDRRVEGRVEEREQAFEAYDQALSEGHGAYLLDQERPNVFTASVGNLPPGQSVTVELTYVALARQEGEATRLTIPTTVSPRYVPPPDGPEVGQPDGERVNPEHRLHVPYGLTLSVEVSGGAVRTVESPSHPVRAELRDDGAHVALSQERAALDRDFVLLVTPREARQPAAIVAREDDGTRVALVTFAPDLATEEDAGAEVLFLLDCSGSMHGESIAEARRALELCIRALSDRDSFNVTLFGTNHVSLWDRARPFDAASLDAAVAWVREVEAALGGTEIYAPLAALLSAPSDSARPRNVLLLTDGEVSNEASVIALAEQHAARARVFSFGIGAGASEHLVRGVARASRGASEMIFPGERVEPKVLRMFNRVRTPALADLRVDWGGLTVEQAPRAVPPVFIGDRLSVFARVTAGDATNVTLVAGERRWEVPIDLEQATLGGAVPTLWARERVRDLEADAGTRGSAQQRPSKGDAKRDALVALGKRYGVLSSATSFVAVEVREAADRTDAPAELRRVPVALTAGWGGIGGVLNPGARAKAAMMPPGMPTGGAMPVRSMAMPTYASLPASAMPKLQRSRGVLGAAMDALASPFKGRRRSNKADAQNPPPAYSLFDERFDSGTSKPSAPRVDRVHAVLLTQHADGHFALSPALCEWLGNREAAFRAAAAQHGEDVVATAVVLRLFLRDAADRRDEWGAAAKKAARWLADRGATFDAATVLVL